MKPYKCVVCHFMCIGVEVSRPRSTQGGPQIKC